MGVSLCFRTRKKITVSQIRSAGSVVAYVRVLWMRNNCPGAIRHCQIHVRNDRHDRNASGDGEGQGEN
jgi:hypothetical protein